MRIGVGARASNYDAFRKLLRLGGLTELRSLPEADRLLRANFTSCRMLLRGLLRAGSGGTSLVS